MITELARDLQRVQTSAEETHKHHRRTEIIRAVCGTDIHLRQGDVKLEFLGDGPCDDITGSLKPTSERQLAPGSSIGSRHVLEGPAKIFARSSADSLTGPVIVVGEESATVTHPTHREYTLPPNTTWGVRYLLDHVTQQRVLD